MQLDDTLWSLKAFDCFRCAVRYGEASELNDVAEVIDLIREKRTLGEN